MTEDKEIKREVNGTRIQANESPPDLDISIGRVQNKLTVDSTRDKLTVDSTRDRGVI